MCCAQVSPGEHYEEASEAEKRPTGRVVGIIRRSWRTRGYAGSLQPPRDGRPARKGGSVLFCPIEKKYPFVRMTTRQVSRRPSLQNGHAKSAGTPVLGF